MKLRNGLGLGALALAGAGTALYAAGIDEAIAIILGGGLWAVATGVAWWSNLRRGAEMKLRTTKSDATAALIDLSRAGTRLVSRIDATTDIDELVGLGDQVAAWFDRGLALGSQLLEPSAALLTWERVYSAKDRQRTLKGLKHAAAKARDLEASGKHDRPWLNAEFARIKTTTDAHLTAVLKMLEAQLQAVEGASEAEDPTNLEERGKAERVALKTKRSGKGEKKLLKGGRHVGPWRLDKKIGEGGQGEVWRVRHSKEKHVPPRALKICFATDEKARQRFENELRHLEENPHAGVMPVLDFDTSWSPGKDHDEASYFVMPLALGTLESRTWASDTLTLLEYFKGACLGLESLHKKAPTVLHRDLKPANILVIDDPVRSVLADFGIAVEEPRQGELTAIVEVVGSPLYRAPEVANGGPASIQSDIYGMGRILERILTGQDPATGPNFRSIPRAERKLSAEAADTLEGVFRKAAAFNPKERFDSVRKLLDALPALHIDVRRPSRRAPPTTSEDVEGAEPAQPFGPLDAVAGLIPFAPGESLGRFRPLGLNRELPVIWKPETDSYLFMAFQLAEPGHPLNPNELRKLVETGSTSVPILTSLSTYGAAHANNRWGRAGFAVPGSLPDGDLEVAQVGLLQFDKSLLGLNGYFMPSEEGDRWVPSRSLERLTTDYFSRALNFYSSALSGPSLVCTVGLAGTAETTLALPSGGLERFSDPYFEDTIAFRFAVSNYDVPAATQLSPFFDHVWASYGRDRPKK